MYRNLVTLALVIFISIFATPGMAQDQVAGDYPKFDGIWETGQGTLALWQAKDAVWGIYGTAGILGGHIDQEGVLHFSYENQDDLGTGWFTLWDDSAGFNGFYTSDVDPGVLGSWEGSMLGSNIFEVGDRGALDYEPGDTEIPEPVEPEIPDETEPVEPTQLPEMTIDPENAWTGTWDTDRGYLVLAAGSGSAIGSFGENGIIEGTLDAAAMSAEWSVTDNFGSVLHGEAIFTMAEDGLSFRGTYNRQDDPNLWLPWVGTKMDEDEIPIPADEHEPVIVEEQGPDVTDQPAIETPVTEEEPAVEEEPVAVEEPVVEETDTETEEADSDEFEITITATGDCWTTLNNRDGRLFVGLMAEGDVLEFSDPIGFRLIVGRPESLIVEFNGEIIEWEVYQTIMVLPPGADVVPEEESEE